MWIGVAHADAPASALDSRRKTVIGSRLKQSGMFWTVQGANDIILSVTPDGAMR
jgi:hypothetical protein